MGMEREEDLIWAPAWRLRELIVGGKISAIEIVEKTLQRLAAVEPAIHAFRTICAAEARSAASEADAAIRSGKPLGPLHGVPVSVKDEAWIRGVRATAGSLIFDDFVPSEDGTVAARLRAAGAIIIGTTNVPEFFSWSRTANRLGPETVNPWDRRRSPGASSGGTAANIAAGVTPLGIGSDGGGSIRIPSAACGLVGMFPTPGRVPDTGSFSYAGVASLGPMGRDMRDIAIAMDVLSGSDGRDPRPCPPDRAFAATVEDGIEGMRLAWSADFGFIDVDRGVAETVGAAARRLAAAGTVVEEPGIKIDDPWPLFTDFVQGDAIYGALPPPFLAKAEFTARCREPGNFSRLMEYNQHRLQAPAVSRAAYDRARDGMARMRERIDALFQHYDAILSPTLPVIAPLLPEGLADPYPSFCCGTYYTSIANLLTLPALTIPAGLVEGMPVGLQMIGRHGREDQLLRIGRALEKLQPFRDHPRL